MALRAGGLENKRSHQQNNKSLWVLKRVPPEQTNISEASLALRSPAPDKTKISQAHRTAQKTQGKKKSRGMKPEPEAAGGVFRTPAPDKSKHRTKQQFLADGRWTVHRTKQNLRTETGRAVEIEFIENHWKSNGFIILAKIIKIQMIFQCLFPERA